MGIKARFTAKEIRDITEEFYNNALKSVFEALKDAAQEIVDRAKNTDTYTDRTGNLRSSIGYALYFEGEMVASSFGGGSDLPTKNSLELAQEVSRDYPKGFVVILVAGMEYAAYVEAKNYDVITGASLQFAGVFQENLNILKEVSGIEFGYVQL